jgi:hypothetical protein
MLDEIRHAHPDWTRHQWADAVLNVLLMVAVSWLGVLALTWVIWGWLT